MEDSGEIVILEIQGTRLECNKNMLTENSDYFSAMFSGNFIEGQKHLKEAIKIQGVELKAFKRILSIISDAIFITDDEDILAILQAASMLQFNDIKDFCVSHIIETLNPSLSLKVWRTAELLCISPLWVHAKYMALEEFRNLYDHTNSFLDFNLDELCLYLGHTYLNVKDELTVFQAGMNWWYEKQKQYSDWTKPLLRLLNCINFNRLSHSQVIEIQTFPDICDNEEIISVLNCVADSKKNGTNIEGTYSKKYFNYAKHLSSAKERKKPEIPCFLLESNFGQEEYSVALSELRKPKSVIEKSIIVFDRTSTKFNKLLVINEDKVRNLVGYKLLAYKEFIFLYGGEYYMIGSGNWNYSFWAYNTLKEKWQQLTRLPAERRHFETLVVDDCIFILGGVGRYRIYQDNLMWYEAKADKWSSIVNLPTVDAKALKCCPFKGQLLIFYADGKCAYIFNKALKTWTKYPLEIEDNFAKKFREFSVLCGGECDYFYVKCKCLLLKFKLEKGKFVKLNEIPVLTMMATVEPYQDIHSIMCNNTIYTLYKTPAFHSQSLTTFESFNLDTGKCDIIFKDLHETKYFVEGHSDVHSPDISSTLFKFNYSGVIENDCCINNPMPDFEEEITHRISPRQE